MEPGDRSCARERPGVIRGEQLSLLGTPQPESTDPSRASSRVGSHDRPWLWPMARDLFYACPLAGLHQARGPMVHHHGGWCLDASAVLTRFARRCALRALERHCAWLDPETIAFFRGEGGLPAGLAGALERELGQDEQAPPSYYAATAALYASGLPVSPERVSAARYWGWRSRLHNAQDLRAHVRAWLAMRLSLLAAGADHVEVTAYGQDDGAWLALQLHAANEIRKLDPSLWSLQRGGPEERSVLRDLALSQDLTHLARSLQP